MYLTLITVIRMIDAISLIEDLTYLCVGVRGQWHNSRVRPGYEVTSYLNAMSHS